MAIDTFMVFVGVYSSVDDATADYQAVHDLHTEDGLIDAYDAAVVERKDNGKVRIVRKHETPTRVGGLAGGTVGLATGLVLALFPGELGEQLDNGQAGLVVVGVSGMGAKIEGAMSTAATIEEKQLTADTAEIRRDVEADLG